MAMVTNFFVFLGLFFNLISVPKFFNTYKAMGNIIKNLFIFISYFYFFIFMHSFFYVISYFIKVIAKHIKGILSSIQKSD